MFEFYPRLATGEGSCLGQGLLDSATRPKKERSVSFLGTGDGSVLCRGTVGLVLLNRAALEGYLVSGLAW